jgi:hypothetical protein
MEQAEQAMVERVINHEMQERFGAGVVQRAVLLQHGEDPAIEPGQLMVRVFVEASDGPGLTAWQSAHRRPAPARGARRRSRSWSSSGAGSRT